jgi:catalase-peroxidase
MENMGFPPHGFGAGRVDTWQADEGVFWGAEVEMFPNMPGSSDIRYNHSTNIYDRADNLEAPLADANMGLIYVDPEGPNGIPDPAASARDIRMTFSRMAMNDEETVALIAGGHAFGKTHGAVPGSYIGPEPNAASIVEQGLGWKNSFGSGNGNDTSTSGIEVIWSKTPTKWANEYLHSLLTRNFSLTKSPAGALQWECVACPAIYPDPFKKNVFHRPKMLTSDIALLHDPVFKKIAQTYYNDFELFTEKFGLAWCKSTFPCQCPANLLDKLLHRDMGPITRYLGPDIPKGPLKLWQDPVPEADYQMIDSSDVASLKSEILATQGLNISNLVTTAWGAAASFRISDKRGGANGGRIQLVPQVNWPSNNPARLQVVLKGLKAVQSKFNKANSSKQVSLADLVVLGGTAAVEAAAKAAGMDIAVRFTPGRNDTTQALTDIKTFNYLKPIADGFVNYGVGAQRSTTEEILVDKAGLLSLSAPEMTVLVGGMRSMNANFDGSSYGILTERPGQLTNDFFMNLLNITTQWQPIANSNSEYFQGNDFYTGAPKYTATRSDLIFGSHPELRAISEVYAGSDASEKFVKDFAAAWSKVMELDRYDIKYRHQDEVQLD